MMLEERRLVDQVLAAEEPCIGAVFCSYTFDPAYFEEHVLRSVLRLTGDPEQDAARYHEEARRALQEVPVACIIDASVRAPGRRLPYDLHLVRKRTFHPKVYLILYEMEARLAVGSGNLTKSGLEQNTELFFTRKLQYGDGADAAILRDISEFLGECLVLSGASGAQLALNQVREALTARLRGAPLQDLEQGVEAKVVSSFGGPLLDQLGSSIHTAAKITRVGVLAPFFEQDDLAVSNPDEGMSTVLTRLLALRPSSGAILDIGVPWDDAPLAVANAEKLDVLDEGIGALWVWRKRDASEGKSVESMDHFVLTGASAKRVEVTNGAGAPARYDRAVLEEAIEAHRLWKARRPTVHAPKAILRKLAEGHEVQLWLHPANELDVSGRALRRLLHAKAILITTEHNTQSYTYALIGSANASQSALGRGVAQGGNVETGILCRFDGEVTIRDLLRSLVNYSIDAVELLERDSPVAQPDLSAWVDEVVHDAAARTLTIKWKTEGPEGLGAWVMTYLEREIAQGNGAGSGTQEVGEFDLQSASAEVTLVANGSQWHLPIRVVDLSALPVNPHLAGVGLRELLALLGRRVGTGRLGALREQRGGVGVSSVLDAIFGGEGFGPTDVFKAWWGSVEDLASASTVAAFRHRLIGRMGVMTAWRHLRSVPEDLLSRDEAWVYGCELLKELKGLQIPQGPDANPKRVLLNDALTELAADLDQLAPVNGQGWLDAVARFYGVGGQRVGA